MYRKLSLQAWFKRGKARTRALVVRPQVSQRTRLVIIAGGAAVLVLSAIGIYNHGSSMADFDRGLAAREYDQLQDELDRVRAENEDLRESLAQAQRSVQMNQTAFQDLDLALKASSQEIVGLREELNFYQNIISPPDKKVGLRVQSLVIEPSGTNEYRFKVVLIQALKNERIVSGSMRLEISGTQGGSETVLRIPATNDSPIKFSFKYFQDLEGKLALAKNFKPRQVKVSVTPSSGGEPVEETYAWPRA